MRANDIHPLVRALSLAWLVPRRALLRRRLGRPVVERVCGQTVRVLPGVFNPVVFRSGAFFAEYLTREHLPAQRGSLSVLDLGTGSGVLALACAAHGHRVMATDLNPKAVECARRNVAEHGLEPFIDVREGDLFAPVAGRRFDLILWNPPFFAGRPGNHFELAWRSDDVIDRFAAALPAYLKPDGTALLVWSSQSDTRVFFARLEAQGLEPELVHSAHFGVERLAIYALRPAAA